MRIDSVPFWANLFLYFFESKYIQQIILVKYLRSYEYHDRSRFKDDLWTVNDSVEFCSSFKNMYPKELDSKRGTSRETYEQFRYYHGVWHLCLLTLWKKRWITISHCSHAPPTHQNSTINFLCYFQSYFG